MGSMKSIGTIVILATCFIAFSLGYNWYSDSTYVWDYDGEPVEDCPLQFSIHTYATQNYIDNDNDLLRPSLPYTFWDWSLGLRIHRETGEMQTSFNGCDGLGHQWFQVNVDDYTYLQELHTNVMAEWEEHS